MDLDEVLSHIGFYILMGCGYGAYIIMIRVLKAMGSAEIMPLWVRIVTLLAIPILSALFLMMFSSD